MHPIYRVTSVGRPVDPKYPTNRAVLWLMLAAALAGAGIALLRGGGATDALAQGALAAVVLFATWAVGRELAPDDNPAAFVAVAIAMPAWWFAPSPHLALLFSALMLVRIVNRSVGVPARPTDTLLVLGLVVYTLLREDGGWLIVPAALAFGLDAVLDRPLRYHALVAALVLPLPWLFEDGVPLRAFAAPNALWPWLLAAIVAVFVVAIVRTRQVTSKGDISDEPLDVTRVRGGMLAGLLCAVSTLPAGFDAVAEAAPLWATLAGVGIASLRR